MLRWSLALLIGLSLSAASPAGAISIDLAPPITGNSWSIQLSLTTPSFAFDTMESFIVPGSDTGAGPWTGDGITGFDLGGWSGTQINPGYSLASGPATQSLTLVWTFAGAATEQIVWDTLFLEGGELRGGLSIALTNGAASLVGSGAGSELPFLFSPDGSGYDRSSRNSSAPIPEPHAAALFGLGALIVAGALRKPFGAS